MLQLAHPKVAQPKLEAFQPWICHWFQYPIQHECQTAQLKPGKYMYMCVYVHVREREGKESVWESVYNVMYVYVCEREGKEREGETVYVCDVCVCVCVREREREREREKERVHVCVYVCVRDYLWM